MKKTLLILLVAIATLSSVAQNRGGRAAVPTIVEVDSLVVERYNGYSPKLEAIIKAYQAETDSVKRLKIEKKYTSLQAQCDAELLAIYTKNLATAGVTERLYALRTSIDKDQLDKIYKRLSAETRREDPYAASIRAHIDTRQVSVGDTLGDFRAETSRGHTFSYSEFKNEKDVLLIFGSLPSLPLEARLMLQLAYRDVDLSQLEIISIFTDETSRAQFEANANYSGVEWLKLCDFRADHSPLKIGFGVQTTPTCFYISRGGAVEYISVGITDQIIELIKLKNYKR